MPRRRRKIKGAFCERKAAPKRTFDRRSFRWKKTGHAWVLVGCPKGSWKARKQRCAVGTRAHIILAPAPKGRCVTGRRVSK